MRRVGRVLVWVSCISCTGEAGGREPGATETRPLETSGDAATTANPLGSSSGTDTTDDANLDSATGTSASTTDTGGGCTSCSAPNQSCVADACVTGCQGQSPDPCGPDQVCDVISGTCHDVDDACTLFGAATPCGEQSCGPGSHCDGDGACIPISPCADVACLDDGQCWGSFCSCTRASDCFSATDAELNGPFSADIGDLEFADDCTAWMVTLRSGQDFVRSLSPAGVLTEYPGVANLNMGEVAVLRALTPQPGIGVGPQRTNLPPPPLAVEGLGEVAITYTCCATCGCDADPPQGVARLNDSDLAEPLAIVIEAVVTTGAGPFGDPVADSGPFGLTWGNDRVLYVGNSTANGVLHTADLEAATQTQIDTFLARVSAGAALTAVHIALAELGGVIHIYNPQTMMTDSVVDVGEDVTSLAFDAFSGVLYASLATLEVVAIRPFEGTSETFETMPSRGRVAVSPEGRLYFTPVKVLGAGQIQSWDLPDSL